MNQTKKQTKLSKQQKMILKVIFKNQKKNRDFKYDNRHISEKVYTEQYDMPVTKGDLNSSFSASVSRSAKRLEGRGLIGRNKPGSMFLTDKGMKYCRSLFGDKIDKYKIGKMKKKGIAEKLGPKVRISPETYRRSIILKEVSKRDKTTAEEWQRCKEGKLSIHTAYKQMIRREEIKQIEKYSPELAKELKSKRPIFTLKETKDILSGKIKLE